MRVSYVLGFAFVAVCVHLSSADPKPAADEKQSAPEGDEAQAPIAADESPSADEEQHPPAADEALHPPAADEPVPSAVADKGQGLPAEDKPSPVDIDATNSRKRWPDMSRETLDDWKFILSHVTENCRREVAQAFAAAAVSFPGVVRPNIFKATGACHHEMYYAFRKSFCHMSCSTRDIHKPDLSFFTELYGEGGEVVRKTKHDETGRLREGWIEAVYKLLYEVKSGLPEGCTEETGLLFDVAIGGSVGILFNDYKKNFRVSEECSIKSYGALHQFFNKFCELETEFGIGDDLAVESKLFKFIEDWHNMIPSNLEGTYREDPDESLNGKKLKVGFRADNNVKNE